MHYRILLFCVLCGLAIQLTAQNKKKTLEIGVVQNLENDSLLNAFGYAHLIESVQKILSPENISDQKFQEQLLKLNKLRVPLFACNIFIPGHLKVVGPDVNHQAVLSYAEKVFQRAQLLNLKMIIWGSGGSRRVPDGFDREQANVQFISIARKLATTAAKYNITLALESLNSTEANFINTVKEALDIVKTVDHKNLRLCIDIYHMLKENEGPDIITAAKGYVVYCELAEKDGRTPPGVHGEDFTPYFKALKKIDYSGLFVIECRWENLQAQGGNAFQVIRQQLDKVYSVDN